MEFLLFQLQAPLASWGVAAVGEFRGTDDYPSQSAIFGLLAAALGLRRDDPQHAALQAGYQFAIGIQETGQLLRDYHTAQVPSKAGLKGRPHFTRKDELSTPKDKRSTILSNRDYRQDSAYFILLQASENAPYRLAELQQALREPRFTLYFGRKSCPPAAPLWPRIIEANDPCAALVLYRQQLQQALSQATLAGGQSASVAPITQLAWSEGMKMPCAPHLSVTRKDRIINRQAWQFGDRIEHRAMMTIGDETCISA